MPNEVISDEGQETVVREDTAKGFRWNKFIGIILAGIILILMFVVLFFSGVFTAVQPNMSPSNSAGQNRSPNP
jgi:hypothetical protein